MMWRKESGLKVCLRSGRADIICLTYYLKKKKKYFELIIKLDYMFKFGSSSC